jgi:hypothetical protein
MAQRRHIIGSEAFNLHTRSLITPAADTQAREQAGTSRRMVPSFAQLECNHATNSPNSAKCCTHL